jgi:hypothetical protein
MKVEGAVVAAETEKVVVVRAEPEDAVAAGNYQESLFVAVPEGPFLNNQSVGVAEREDAGRESWAAEGDLPEESWAVENSDFERDNRFA